MGVTTGVTTERSAVPLTIVAGGPELPGLVAQLLAVRPGTLLIGPHRLVETAVAGLAALDPPTGAGAGLRLEVVEPDVGERTAGCPCCRERLDVVDAVRVHLRRRDRPRRVVVAVPAPSAYEDRLDGAPHGAPQGRSSVAVVARTVLADPELRRHVRLDAVVTSLDAVAAVTRLRTGADLVIEDDEIERLAVADRLVVGRADQVAADAFAELVGTLRGVNRIAPVLAPALSPVRAAQLLDLDAWHGAPAVAPAGAVSDVPGASGLHTVVLEQRGVLDPGGVEEWLDELVRAHAPRLLRLQGALAVEGQPHRVCCHGVGSYAMSHPEHQHEPGRRSSSSLMVLVGERLPADRLAEDLARTVLR